MAHATFLFFKRVWNAVWINWAAYTAQWHWQKEGKKTLRNGQTKHTLTTNGSLHCTVQNIPVGDGRDDKRLPSFYEWEDMTNSKCWETGGLSFYRLQNSPMVECWACNSEMTGPIMNLEIIFWVVSTASQCLGYLPPKASLFSVVPIIICTVPCHTTFESKIPTRKHENFPTHLH